MIWSLSVEGVVILIKSGHMCIGESVVTVWDKNVVIFYKKNFLVDIFAKMGAHMM